MDVVLIIIKSTVLDSDSEVAWIMVDKDKYTLGKATRPISTANSKQQTRSTRP
jgi:hypothetical protein